MDQLPEQPTVSAPAQVSNWRKVLELGFLALLLAAFIGFLYLVTPKNLRETKALAQKVEQTTFQTGKFKEYILSDLAQVAKEKQSGVQFVLYSKVFDNLASEYGASRNSQIRQIAADLKAFLAKNYPKLYEEERFYLVCIETSCGQPEADDKLNELKERIEDEVSDAAIKTNLLDTLERASWLTNDSEKLSRFNQLGNGFVTLAQYAKTNKDPEIQKTVLLYREYMSSNFADLWAQSGDIWEKKAFKE